MTDKKAKSNASDHDAPPPSAVLERLEPLIQELSSLRYDDEEERFEDIVAELINSGEEIRPRLEQMATSLSYQERRAAVQALGSLKNGSKDPALIRAIYDANWKVRRTAAQVVVSSPNPELLYPLFGLLEDEHRELRIAAITAIGEIRDPVGSHALEETLKDSDWRIRQESATALGKIQSPSAITPLLQALSDDDEDVREASNNALQGLLSVTSTEVFLTHIGTLDEKQQKDTLEALKKLPHSPTLAVLLENLSAKVSAQVDVDELSRFGRVITTAEERTELDRAFFSEKYVDEALKHLKRNGNNSLILLGESGVGKTAIIHELAQRLSDEDEDFTVLESSTPELMVGTKYIGEWETKLRDMIEKIKKPRKVLLYLTNVNDLPGAGTTSSNKQNFVTLLAPYMRRGDITLLGESTPEAMRRGIEKDLSTKRLFQTITIKEPNTPTTHKIIQSTLKTWSEKHGVSLTAPFEVQELLIDLSGTYYSTMAQPGRSITVLRQAVDIALEEHNPLPQSLELTSEHVIQGLARFTGLPELLLNDKLPLNTRSVRDFFEHRVLGQPEAVDTIVDLITLIKAGLTDPSKPFGVFLFVGPTGVGKTELAKSLAEFIFGSEKRLLRYDLSEYKDYDSFERLIGARHRNEEGRLTSKVRENPFSVILLDEIEKAHPNVFDLFLQVFDDGRLTDAQGRVADFRHSIIIMTSNLASAFSPGGNLGFSDDGRGGLASRSGVLREVQRFFRPEFINRIDHTVVFRTLGAEVMRKIAQRELGKALMRSGLLRRRLIVDIDPSIVDDLMEQGFSPSFGARPLKRAVEKRVMLPVAREIVARGPDYKSEILQVSSKPDPNPKSPRRVLVERAEIEPQTTLPKPPDPPHDPDEGRALLHELEARQNTLTEAFPLLQQRIQEAEKATHSLTFWDNPPSAREKLTRLVRLQTLRSSWEESSSLKKNAKEALQPSPPLPEWRENLLDWHKRILQLESRQGELDTDPGPEEKE